MKLVKQRLQQQKQQQQREEEAAAEEEARDAKVIEFNQRRASELNPSLLVSPSILVFNDFCTREEETCLLRALARESKWTILRNRRVQCFGGDPAPNATRTALPDWLQLFIDKALLPVLQSVGGGSEYEQVHFNHVLVNEYKPGEGILPHTDGPMYSTITITLSLGDCSGDMVFTPRLSTEQIGRVETRETFRLTLAPRCLVVFFGEAYTDMLHSIDNVCCAAAAVEGGAPRRRISFTFRNILV